MRSFRTPVSVFDQELPYLEQTSNYCLVCDPYTFWPFLSVWVAIFPTSESLSSWPNFFWTISLCEPVARFGRLWWSPAITEVIRPFGRSNPYIRIMRPNIIPVRRLKCFFSESFVVFYFEVSRARMFLVFFWTFASHARKLTRDLFSEHSDTPLWRNSLTSEDDQNK